MSTEEIKIDTEYSEIAGHIKATDEISVKVLGFVPLASGATVLGLLLEGDIAKSPMIFVISAFSAVVVFGFFRWELRNIQTCAWLYARACEIDGSKRPEAPGGFGKTEAECLIYAATIGLWLLLPWFLLLIQIGAQPAQALRSILIGHYCLLLGSGPATRPGRATLGYSERISSCQPAEPAKIAAEPGPEGPARQ